MTEIERLTKLVKVQQKYISVLGAEINSFAPLMWSHGWKSSPESIRRGAACRVAIEKLSKKPQAAPQRTFDEIAGT